MPEAPSAQRPQRLLTKGNRRLAAIDVYSWTIPALAARLDGVNIQTCPSAGICASVCYATVNSYRYPKVRERHLANLRFVVEDPGGWEKAMIAELAASRYKRAWVRLHDAGDFFSDAYTLSWMRIMRAAPETRFYAYTKEVRRLRRLVEPAPPENFLWAYSFGGRDDHLLDPETDRTVDVFPTTEAITAAGWHPQRDSDLDSVLGPAPVGLAANNIPHFLKLLDGRTFREWQAEVDGNRRRRPCSTATNVRQHTRTGPSALMQRASPCQPGPSAVAETGDRTPAAEGDPETRGHPAEGKEARHR